MGKILSDCEKSGLWCHYDKLCPNIRRCLSEPCWPGYEWRYNPLKEKLFGKKSQSGTKDNPARPAKGT